MKKKIILIMILLFQLNIIFSEDINLNLQDINITENKYIYDNANLFNYTEKIILENKLRNLSNHNLSEFIIVTINSLNNIPIDIYSINLVQNQLGSNTNNGILLLISKEDQKYRFEIGRGLEEYLNDGKIGKIGREVLIPSFKEDKYFTGVNLIINRISKEIKYAEFSIDSNSDQDKSNNLYFLVLFFIIIYSILIIKNNSNKENKNNQNKIKEKNKSSKIKKNKEDYILKENKPKKIKKRIGKFGGGGSSGKW